MMKWEKIGLIFNPQQGGADWMKTHAQVPTPLLCDNFIRIYFASRPERTLSLTSYVDVDANDPSHVIAVCPHPILLPGPPGSFDEHGIMPSSVVRKDNLVYLYYSGWSRSASVPYLNSTGLAISEDGGTTFHKVSEGPILSRDRMNPYSATSPCVLYEQERWNMWFCSGTGWIKVNDKFEHTYNIRHAKSTDGVDWTTSIDVAIAQRIPLEAITRPYVWRDGSNLNMLFCYRGSHDFRDGIQSYRMGFAQSTDDFLWQRHDEDSGLKAADEGWDSKMVAYPAILKYGKKVYLFYNGNDFGAYGFGYAQSEVELP